MEREELMKILPHRDAMLLLDGADREGDEARGRYLVRGDEWFLKGHYPGDPIVPGVVLCEIMAQSVCVLLSSALDADKTPVYTGIDRARFHSPVRPGELFETRCRVKRVKKPFYFAEGEGYVGERLCVKAEFSFALVEK